MFGSKSGLSCVHLQVTNLIVKMDARANMEINKTRSVELRVLLSEKCY